MPDSGKHILESFDSALSNLQNDLMMMASLVERNVRNAYKGLITRDDDLCNVAIADDEEVDALEVQIDQKGIEILRRFQPVATDLRSVVTAMKINGNLERVADQATNIAKKARKLNRAPLLNEVSLIEPLFEDAIGMYKDALKAYAERDVTLAMTIHQRDKKLDAMNVEANDRLTEAMAQCPTRITDYLNLLFIARHMERVGDHAKNIAEEVVYAVSAEDIRHTRSEPSR